MPLGLRFRVGPVVYTTHRRSSGHGSLLTFFGLLWLAALVVVPLMLLAGHFA